MKVECENLSEREATSELIRELIRDDARRGEFMILMQDADEEAFVQIAGDYEDVGGRNGGCFDLEYRDFREKLKAAAETSRVKVHLRYRGGKLRNFDIRPEDLAAATGCDLCLKLEVLGGGIDDRSECDRLA